MPNSFLIPAAALAAVTALSGAAAASEYRCERADETVRRVEIAVEDPASGVPCEVVYWKDHEEPGVRRVLWNAQTDAGFCQRKAKELVATLEEGGWDCAAPSPTTPPATREAGAERPPSEQPPSAADTPADASAQAESQDPGTNLEPSPEPAPAQRETAERQTGAQGASEQKGPGIRAALSPERPSQPGPEPAPGEPANGSPAITVLPETTVLNTIIEQNLVRLNDGVEGEFAAEIGRYGDLDGDGLEDGLVFFTYQSERLGEARFIAAYLYDGESYTLAATKPVAGSDDRIHSAEVEAIEGGVISLRLNVLEPGDAACCPSGTRHQTLVLQGGQLIEVSNSDSPRSDSPS